MKSIIYYIYGAETPILPLYQRLYTGTIDEAIGWCLKIKEDYDISPLGFAMIDYEDNKESMVDIINDAKYYYFNGKIITPENIPRHWNNIKNLKQYNKLVYINEYFCYPFDETKDTIININI